MQLDDVIGQAQAVSSNLGEQRQLFENIGNKLVSVSSKFPVVNGVMNAIRRKKNRASLLLKAGLRAQLFACLPMPRSTKFSMEQVFRIACIPAYQSPNI